MHDAALEWQSDVFSGAAHTWDQIKVLKDNWDGPYVSHVPLLTGHTSSG